jgi:hypothetical protein
VFWTIQIKGKQHYLWRAADQDGEVVDVYLQEERDGAAAKRFFRRLLRNHDGEPRKTVTEKLRSYPVAQREMMPYVVHVTAHATCSPNHNVLSLTNTTTSVAVSEPLSFNTIPLGLRIDGGCLNGKCRQLRAAQASVSVTVAHFSILAVGDP